MYCIWRFPHNFKNHLHHQFLVPVKNRNLSVIRQKGDLKTGVSRKKCTPTFPKNERFLPSDTQKCAYQRVRNTLFQTIWRTLFP